jgi:Domain of Unknown Function with PDB structure (DUF3857)/Transglutaminase-like superfamily
MNRVATVLFICFFVHQATGADYKYPVSDIPADLMKNADVVVREDAMIFRIQAKNHATLTVRFVATILNNKGNSYARIAVTYSKLDKINALSGTVFDGSGSRIVKLKNSEIQDQSLSDGETLYRDDRVKTADLKQSSFPYTVEFEYEVEYKYLYDIPDSWLLPDERVSAQHVSYQLIFPPNLVPRYHLVNVDQLPKKEQVSGGLESWAWSFENLKPITIEPNGPGVGEILPRIMVAPTKFEYEGYEGDMSSWEAYGKWIALLNKGRDGLPPETRKKIKELTAGLVSDEAKARALYTYMQGKTRYVNIKLGIGGLQPFSAEVVDQNGYGDCKALSNYMVALLKEAGIKACYATIMAGDHAPDVITSFPSHQANHAIVAIPHDSDTLWLECTSQTNPFAYIGRFTGDRKALLITDNGGVLVNTSRYPDTSNCQKRIANVYLDAAGNAKGSVSTIYSGLQYEAGGLDFILNQQRDSQKKWILKHTSIPSFNLDQFHFESNKAKSPVAIVELDLTLNRLASVSGKRLFLTPNLMSRSTILPEKIDDRKTNIVQDFGYVNIDSIIYYLPTDIYPEFVPEPIKLVSPFGRYEATFIIDEGSLLYVRRLTVNKGRFEPSMYGEFADFYKAVSKADNIKLVFLDKT